MEEKLTSCKLLLHIVISLKKIAVWLLLQCILSQFLYALIINQRMIIYCVQKTIELIQLYPADIACTNNHCDTQSNHKRLQFNLIRCTHCSFDSELCFIMFNLFVIVQQKSFDVELVLLLPLFLMLLINTLLTLGFAQENDSYDCAGHMMTLAQHN